MYGACVCVVDVVCSCVVERSLASSPYSITFSVGLLLHYCKEVVGSVSLQWHH